MNHKFFDTFTSWMLLLAGLCLGLVGAFQFDLMATLFDTVPGEMSSITRFIYLLIGVSTVYRFIRYIQIDRA